MIEVSNETQWPMCISLDHLTPVYYQNVVRPGEVFRPKTGMFWFTIKACINPDAQQLITPAKCVLPVIAIVGAVVASATGGAPIATSAALVSIAGAVIGGCAQCRDWGVSCIG